MTPPSMTLQKPDSERQQLLDALSSPLRKTTPFLWLHYGDGDFMTMSGMYSESSEKSDMMSPCVRQGIADMFLGHGPEAKTSRTHVFQAVGAFFLCKETHEDIYTNMEKFLKRHPGDIHGHKFSWFDDFYFPVGNATASPKDSWVVAAKRRGRPIVLVGPKHLDYLGCMLDHEAFFEIPIPTKGCGDVDRLVPQLVSYSKSKYPDDSVLFVVAGGAIGKMIAYKAFHSLNDKDVFVDVGATLDGYAGVPSRDYNIDSRKFCKESKAWMAWSPCMTACSEIQPDIKCHYSYDPECRKW